MASLQQASRLWARLIFVIAATAVVTVSFGLGNAKVLTNDVAIVFYAETLEQVAHKGGVQGGNCVGELSFGGIDPGWEVVQVEGVHWRAKFVFGGDAVIGAGRRSPLHRAKVEGEVLLSL